MAAEEMVNVTLSDEELFNAMEEVEGEVVSKELVEKRKRLLHECKDLEVQLNLIKAKIRQIW